MKRKFCVQRSIHLKKCIKSGKSPADYFTFCNAFYGVSNNIQNNIHNNIQNNISNELNQSNINSKQEPEITLSSILSHTTNQDSNLNGFSSINQSNVKFKQNELLQTKSKLWDDSSLDYETNQLATKHLKHAISALSFDDVDTAIDLILKCHSLLKPFSKK